MNWMGLGLTPHGFCLLWEPALLTWTMVGDGATALAYFWIPLQLALASWRIGRGGRLVLTDNPILMGLFAAFILLCGLTHITHIVTLFVPAYWPEALLTLATGAVSLLTAGMMQWVVRPGASSHELANVAHERDALARQYRRLAAGDMAHVASVLKDLDQRGIAA